MNVRFQKVSAFILVLVLCTGLLTVPASATESSSIANMWDTFFQTTSPIYSLIKNFLPDGVSPEKATSAQKKDAYKQYVTNIQNNYGTTSIGSSGILCPLTPDGSFSTLYPTNKNIVSGAVGYSSFVYKTSSAESINSTCYMGKLPANSAVSPPGYLSLIIDGYSKDILVNFESSSLMKAADGYIHMIPIYPEKLAFTSNAPISSLAVEFVFPSGFVEGLFATVYVRAWLLYQPYGYDVNSFTQNIGGEDSRVGKFSGDFGYYGDNGELIVADNVQIVNEGDKTIYNPVTGETSIITDWTYNYDNRTYELTLDTGDKITVTYGDENVTINQGDTIFNIYYIVPGGGDPTPTPSPSPSSNPDVCKHKYTSKVTTEPGCTSVGITTFTCSLCGDAYTEKIPATGHSWVVDRVVEDTKDEEGKVTSKGYTVYKCSVCGQEYKDAEGTGPPEEEEKEGFLSWLLGKIGELLGSIGEGIVNLLKTALGKILDGLIAIVDMLAAKLSEVLDVLFRVFDEIPKMFEGFTEFLGSMFSFLPPEVTTIIIFGILAIVLVAIIKMFLK